MTQQKGSVNKMKNIIDSIKANHLGHCYRITIERLNEGDFADLINVEITDWWEDEQGEVTGYGNSRNREFSVTELGYVEALKQARKTFDAYKQNI